MSRLVASFGIARSKLNLSIVGGGRTGGVELVSFNAFDEPQNGSNGVMAML